MHLFSKFGSRRELPEHPILDIHEMLGGERLYPDSLHVDAQRRVVWTVARSHERTENGDFIVRPRTRKLLRIDLERRECQAIPVEELGIVAVTLDDQGTLYGRNSETQLIVRFDNALKRQETYAVGDFWHMAASSHGTVLTVSPKDYYWQVRCYSPEGKLWERILPPPVYEASPIAAQGLYAAVLVSNYIYVVTFDKAGNTRTLHRLFANDHRLMLDFNGGLAWGGWFHDCTLGTDGRNILLSHDDGFSVFDLTSSTERSERTFYRMSQFKLPHRHDCRIIIDQELLALEQNLGEEISRLHLIPLRALGRGKRIAVESQIAEEGASCRIG